MALKYSDLGYNVSGYVVGDTFVPIQPVNQTIIVGRTFLLDSVDISAYVTDCEIIRENGKAFTAMSLEIKGHNIPKTSIRNPLIRLEVTLGTDYYSFIIIDVDRSHDGSQSVLCKTQGCMLDVPFSTVSNGSVLGTSNEVIETLTANISSFNSLPDFKFHRGNFLLSGSNLDSLDTIVDVCGGTYYEKNDRLFIEPHFRIPSGAVPSLIIGDDILTAKEYSDNIDGSALLKKITFNPQLNDIKSETLITMITPDKGCQRPIFLFNPEPNNMSEIISNLGDMTFTLKQVTYVDTISNTSVIRVDGAIRTIDSITVDGVDLADTDYSFEVGHNVILFNAGVTGGVKIIYTTKTISHYEKNGYYNETDKSYLYKVQFANQVLNQSIPRCSEGDADTNLSGCSVRVSDNVNRGQVFTIDILNGALQNLVFVSNAIAPVESVPLAPAYVKKAGNFDSTFLQGVTETLDVPVTLSIQRTVENVTGELGFNDDVEYYGFVTPIGMNESEIMIGSRIIQFGWIEEGKDYRVYYTTDSTILNGNAVIAFDTTVTRYTIPACGTDNPVHSVDVYACNGLTTIEYGDDVCLLPALLEVDVPSLLDTTPEKVAGKVITLGSVTPNVDITLPTSGVFSYTFTQQMQYVFDTHNVRRGSTITVDTTNAEFA